METNPTAYRDYYRKGRVFRVIGSGAYITGSAPAGPYAQSCFRLNLFLGDLLVCAGIGRTMGDGVSIVKWQDAEGNVLCNDAEFQPAIGSLWASLPDPACLEPADIDSSIRNGQEDPEEGGGR